MPQNIKVGVLHAGGKGTRAYPKTEWVPKVMLEVEGKPILQRNLEILRDKLNIRELIVVIGYKGGMVKKYFGDGSKFGVRIRYVNDTEMKGLAHATYLLRDYIKEPFIMILGDEIYIGSNHEEINAELNKFKDFMAICGINKTVNSELIKKNYSVEIKNSRIKRIIEKPKIVTNNFLGCGSYILTPKFFDFIYKTPKSQRTGRIELMEVIDKIAREEDKVYPFFLKGDYININNVEDLNTANYVIRDKNFDNYKISLIIPTKNEGESIGKVINDFRYCNRLKEIIVIDSSKDETAKIAKKIGGEIVRVERGNLKYGEALKHGMNIARGDILILVEADGTFRSKDTGKIIEYMKDADMVIGTRTTRQMIEQGSNMGWFLRWGNVFLGKLIEFLWWNQEPRFTDVGCTFRGIWKESYLKIRDNLQASGPEFSPEMMIETLKARLRVIEIPVSYYKRFSGESKNSKGFKKIKTGLKMLDVILGKKFGWKK